MKRCTILFFAVFLLFFGVREIIAVENDGKPEKKFEVEIIKNPNQPVMSFVELSLEENLSIGNSEIPDYYFERLNSMAVGKDGSIVALDPSSGKIKMFDANGKFLRSFGRKGPGPQEFLAPSCLTMDGEENIYVVDRNRYVKKFTKEGKLLKILKLDKRCISAAATADGEMALVYKDYNNYRNAFVTLHLEKKNMDGATTFEFPLKVTRKEMLIDGNERVFFQTLYFDPDIVYAISPTGLLYCGINQSYNIQVYDTDNTKIREIFKEEKPTRFNGAEKERLAGGNGHRSPQRQKKIRRILPDIKPFFWRLIVDEKEWLYAFRTTSISGGGPYLLDVFDSKGEYIYRTESPIIPQTVIKGHCYNFTYNEAEDLLIKRYKMTFSGNEPGHSSSNN